MTRRIVYTKPEANQKPAIRVEFKGRNLNDYYALRKIAREDFAVSQTELSRRILQDFLKMYREAKKEGNKKLLDKLQTALYLENP